jgi:hypothetical protein
MSLLLVLSLLLVSMEMDMHDKRPGQASQSVEPIGYAGPPDKGSRDRAVIGTLAVVFGVSLNLAVIVTFYWTPPGQWDWVMVACWLALTGAGVTCGYVRLVGARSDASNRIWAKAGLLATALGAALAIYRISL